MPLLDRRQEIALAKRVEIGDLDAKNKLIEHNIRLVISIAKDYTSKGMELGDLINDGSIGLMRAIELYDYRKAKLSTFAYKGIHTHIKRALDNSGRTVRVPVHMEEQDRILWRAEGKLETELGRRATLGEIVVESGWTEEQVLNIYEIRERHWLKSLDAPVSEESETTLGDLVADTTPEPIDDEKISDRLQEAFSILTDKEREVIMARYGFYHNAMTMREAAAYLKVSTASVGQAQKRAERRLVAFLDPDRVIEPKPKAVKKPKPPKPRKKPKPRPVPTHKVCNVCEIEKSVDEFYPKKYNSGRMGWRNECKLCKKSPTKETQ